MKRIRFNEKQIIGVLKTAAKTADLARRHRASEATVYKWKAKYCSLEASEARCLRQLDGENAKFKRLLTDPTLDNAALIQRAAQPTIFCQESFDDRGYAGSCGSSPNLSRDEIIAGVQGHRCLAWREAARAAN